MLEENITEVHECARRLAALMQHSDKADTRGDGEHAKARSSWFEDLQVPSQIVREMRASTARLQQNVSTWIFMFLKKHTENESK